MKRNTKECKKCGRFISISNYNRHFNSCSEGVKEDKSLTLKDFEKVGDKYQCPICNKLYTKMGIGYHYWKNHTDAGKKFNPNKGYKDGSITVWNKGLTKDDHPSILQSISKVSKALKGITRNPLSEEHKRKISNSMKKAHKERRAWNIGKSRWNNEPSYPEAFFMKVIDNNFEDKDYIREYPIGIYSVDFAWVSKKLAIEIDGEQHGRFEEYKQRDQKKDKLLINNGWEVLRIKWKDVCNNPKNEIKKAIDFIH